MIHTSRGCAGSTGDAAGKTLTGPDSQTSDFTVVAGHGKGAGKNGQCQHESVADEGHRITTS